MDFSLPAERICCAVRGFSPWPVAYTLLSGRRLKVYAALPCAFSGAANAENGEVVCADGRLIVRCEGGFVELTDVQLEGSRRMPAADMLKGRAVKKGDILGR